MFDTSALAKRYHTELGTACLDALIPTALNHQSSRLIISSLVVAEVVSVLKRKQNAQHIQQQQLDDALVLLDQEAKIMTSLAVDDVLIANSHNLILQHNINTGDAVLLRQAVDLAQPLAQAGHQLWLVASDVRLLRAAASEGLATLNPETFDPAQVVALLA